MGYSRLPQVTVDDRGNTGKTLQGGINGSLSSRILLALDVSPVNDPPIVLIPTSIETEVPLFAEEDRIGIIGADCCGWSNDNTHGSTIISNSSIVVTDADITYDFAAGGITPQQSYSRWTLAQAHAREESALKPTHVNDTVTLTVSATRGGILLSGSRSKVSVTDISEEREVVGGGDNSLDFFPSLAVVGPMWAVAESLKGMRYRTSLNWNSWAGLGTAELEHVVLEVS